MQAYSSRWTDPVGTLGRIVSEARLRALALVPSRGDLEARAATIPIGTSLHAALRGPSVALLTEVKRRSPSKGDIAAGLDAAEQARLYTAGGAAGISVLTEPDHFCGSIDDLIAVKKATSLPTLKKDFHVDPVQLIEARALGASAALLIARALHPDALEHMMRVGAGLGLELLVEVRDEDELQLAIELGATMIGVNNRNLETLVIDPTTCDRLIPMVPVATIAIAESGVNTRWDVERYANVGADAVLVGSSLSSAENPDAATRAIAGVTRRDRAR